MNGIIYKIDEESGKSVIDELRETKQDKLVSGENIKTINGESILGSGNLAIKDCVQTFASRTDFPIEGSSAIIYIAQDTDKQYSWDNGEYVELSKEDELLILDSNTIFDASYTASDDEIRKAREGKVVIYHENYPYYVSAISSSAITFSTIAQKPSYTPYSFDEATVSAVLAEWDINLDLNTRKYSASSSFSPYNRTVQNTPDNFVASSATISQGGRRIIRECNVYGKLIPAYTASDAGKILKINAQGNFPILAEDESLKGIEVVDYQTTTALTQAQIDKAKVGKLAVRYYQGNYLMLFYGGYSSTTVTFRTFAYMGTSTAPYANFASSKEIAVMEIPLNTTTGMFGSVTWNNKMFAEDASANVFASNVIPAHGGRRIVREMNIAGRIIPSYSSLDAGKHVAINSNGNGVELVDDTFATDLEAKRLFRTEYDVTVNVTNGAFTGDENVWTRETATVTLTPNADYALSGTITVTNASYVYDDVTGEVVISKATGNVTITCVCVPVPSKGDLITMSGKTFRVLKTNGRKCDVMCLTDETCAYYDSNPQTIDFVTASGTQTGLKYEYSTLDTYLNETWFGALSSDIQNAIIEQEVLQDLYNTESSDEPYPNTVFSIASAYRTNRISVQSYRLTNKRKVRALDVNDFCEYFNHTTEPVPRNDIREFLFNATSGLQSTDRVSLNSAYGSAYVQTLHCGIDGITAYIGAVTYSTSCKVRPVFKVDISQVAWTIQQ